MGQIERLQNEINSLKTANNTLTILLWTILARTECWANLPANEVRTTLDMIEEGREPKVDWYPLPDGSIQLTATAAVVQ